MRCTYLALKKPALRKLKRSPREIKDLTGGRYRDRTGDACRVERRPSKYHLGAARKLRSRCVRSGVYRDGKAATTAAAQQSYALLAPGVDRLDRIEGASGTAAARSSALRSALSQLAS